MSKTKTTNRLNNGDSQTVKTLNKILKQIKEYMNLHLPQLKWEIDSMKPHIINK